MKILGWLQRDADGNLVLQLWESESKTEPKILPELDAELDRTGGLMGRVVYQANTMILIPAYGIDVEEEAAES